MDSHYPPDGRYPPPPSQSHPPPPQQQQQQQQHHQWGPAPQLHLQVPQTLASSTFPSPVSPSPSISDYPHYYHPHPHHPQHHDGAALSLNLSGLSVASPTTVSPIHPSPHPSTSSTLSPITPLTPPTHAYLASQHGQFSFAPPYDAPQYDYRGSSRSSSCSEKSVPKKRSFSTTPLATSLEEHPDAYAQQGHGAQMDYEELDGMGYPPMEGSPVDGSTSSGEMDEPTSTKTVGHTDKTAYGGIPAGSINILGKPAGTNNFVTKLYQMINDPKSAQFISWTDLGTSFVVSNVGEFSRSILGSHFKHNNFSSFVRQLNMYGFHKINRTPRAQRTTTDAQTWEFSHHKFLRGRPDLLDEIKRKALEPDLGVKQRVELPGEVAAQLQLMREENGRRERELKEVRRRCERLGGVVNVLWEAVAKAVPGGVPMAFPSDLLDPLPTTDTSPNIYITHPSSSSSSSQQPQPQPNTFTLPSLHHHPSLHSLHSLSPSSSPTTGEFPSPKRPRVEKRLARARSDSAPLGYALGGQVQGRPRSGSGMAQGERWGEGER